MKLYMEQNETFEIEWYFAVFNNFLFFVSELFLKIEQGTKWPFPNQNWIKSKKKIVKYFLNFL